MTIVLAGVLMSKISLSENYIQVTDELGHKIGFGGNQNWFSKEPWNNISGQGCGMIAAMDFSLYVTGARFIELPEYQKLSEGFIKRNPFVNFSMHEFSKAGFSLGVLPRQICRYINHSCPGIKASWDGVHGHKDMLEKMKAMISEDIPVIWAIYRFNRRLPLYDWDSRNNAYTIIGTTNSHYVNAISVIENPELPVHKIMIEISSWGRQFFIDYDEYLEFVGSSILSRYCSNIVSIRKK